MRFTMLVRDATKESEAGVLPDEKAFAEMGKFNEEMVKAGVLLAAEGLHPSAKGTRVRFSAGKPITTEGPFAELKELVCGFWLIQVRSKEEAIAWAKRVPFQEGEIEIRQVLEAEDFGPAFTPELREAEQRQRARAKELGGP